MFAGFMFGTSHPAEIDAENDKPQDAGEGIDHKTNDRYSDKNSTNDCRASIGVNKVTFEFAGLAKHERKNNRDFLKWQGSDQI